MQSLKTVAVASLLVAVAALTCYEEKGGPAKCEGDVCFFRKKERFWGVFHNGWDITSGCMKDTSWCDENYIPFTACRHWKGDEFCCCTSYENCTTEWFRQDYMVEPPTTTPPPTTPPTSTATTSTAAATTGTTAPLVCSENKDAYQGLVCPSRICYRLLSGDGDGAPLDYGCADRVDERQAPPAEVVVAVCSGKWSYCFDSTDADDAAVRMCCCDTDGCNRESLGALPPAAATAPTVALVPLAVALAAHLL